MDKKVVYPSDWKDMIELWLDAPHVIDQDCLFKKDPILDLQKAVIKNYVIYYTKQYEVRNNINNTLKTFVEKWWSPKRSELFKPVQKDFENKNEYEAYTTNASHLFSLYQERDALQTNLKTIREQLLDIKRFPNDK